MRFILGLVTGLVAGAAGAVIYSIQTGRDLREEFELVRSEIRERDFDKLSNHLEERIREVQGIVEERLAKAEEAGSKSASDSLTSIEIAADDTSKAMKDAAKEPATA